MRAPSRVLWAAGLTLFAAACATFVGTRAGVKRHIAPHEIHTKAEVDCLACHETIFDAESLKVRNLPPEAKCLECHKQEKESGNCAFCHVGKPVTYAPVERHLTFNHLKHLEENEDCSVCHKVLPEPGVAANVTPKKADCNQCHVHQAQFDNGECQVCHLDMQRYGLVPITAFTHGGDYLRRHAQDALAGQACATCHMQSFCADCHATPGTVPLRMDLLYPERIDRQFIHRNDFESRHSVEARADQSLCLKCHTQNDCQSCHTVRGVSGSNPLVNPHPQDYALGQRHGRDARMDIVSCASCHDQGAQSICVDCHRVGGVGGNPHPPSWQSRHGREEIERNGTCLACHR